MVKTILFVLTILMTISAASSQEVVVNYAMENFDEYDFDSLLAIYGKYKKLPVGYELQALLALSHYPELKKIKIKFRFKKKGAPFISRPTIWSTFFRNRKKRNYLVLIRREEDSRFAPILMHNMPFNAQIGVLGHELAHTADFSNRGLLKMLSVVFGNLSMKFLDDFEFQTDRRTIEHGLGFQLHAWSKHASATLRVNESAPSDKKIKVNERERYMRPNTIKKEMKQLKIYHLFL